MKERRLFAVDPSLTCSGWAFFSLGSGTLLGVGKLRSLGPIIPLSNRLKNLQVRVENIFEGISLSQNDVLICEGETSMKDPRAAFKVEQVRGIFEAVARSRKVLVPGRISPRSIQHEIMGFRGVQQKRDIVKRSARGIVASMFGSDLQRLGFEATDENLVRNQDIVDAILVGVLSLSKLKMAYAAESSPEEVFSQVRARKRNSRYGWGKGESNTFGWSEAEIKKFLVYGK